MDYNLERFVDMHKMYYHIALQEIKDGKKRSHWMWYIFPQLKGLGQSSMSEYYGLSGIDETQEYMKNEILRHDMQEVCVELLKNNDLIDNILGFPDNLKLKSSMTLFGEALPEEQIFKQVLEKFYKGEKDIKTLEMLKEMRQRV